MDIGSDWDELLKDEWEKPYFQQLTKFLADESARGIQIYPALNDVFNALKYTPYSEVKVVIIGQDPYINHGEAHGLAFSVNPGVKIPPSLINIYRELQSDIGCNIPGHGCLTDWAKQGVLLLNTLLTVEHGKSRSHVGKGWETFTNRILELVDNKPTPVVFMLWGQYAQQKMLLIKHKHHLLLLAAHPSPLAGGRFFGCKHFSKANEFLLKHGMTKIDWEIKEEECYKKNT
jgi:uracil-DNA glycosylase